MWMRITIKNIPVEPHQSVGLGKWYYSRIRRVYTFIHKEISNINSKLGLQMLLRVLKNSVRSNNLMLKFYVFSTYLTITKINLHLLIITQQTMDIRKIIEDIWHINVQWQVHNKLNTRNRPSPSKIFALFVNSLVFIYKESRLWTYLYKLLSIKEEFASINLLSWPTKFRTTIIRPYHQAVWREKKRRQRKHWDFRQSWWRQIN